MAEDDTKGINPEDEKEIISLINDWIVKHLYDKVD